MKNIFKKIFIFVFLSIFSFSEDNFFLKQENEEIKLSYFPKRIITDSAILTRYFASLDIDLVGVPNSSTKIPDRYNSIKRIGKAGMPDLELIKIQNTDLVISTLFSKPTVKPKYDMIGVPSVYLDIETYDKSKDMVKILAQAFHREKKGEEILNSWDKREESLKSKLIGKSSKKVVIIYGNGESFFMVGKKHFLQELLDKINCENLVTNLESSAVDKKNIPFSLEQLITLNPDIILILPNSKTKNGKIFLESFDKNPIWKLTKAYQNKSIHIIDPTLFRMSAGINSIDALEELYRYVYE